MPKKTLYILLLLPVIAMAQQDHIWYFGDRAGLDFNSGTPQVLMNGQLSTNEGCSTVSDLSGNLLFYTNGVTVWTRDHQVMENGTGLLGDISSSQSAIIVQKPGHYHIYYVFTAAAALGEAGISYSEVDMTAAGGLGAVIVKNIPLVTPACEKLTAGLHANGLDVWVIAHGWQNNSFYSYRVTGQGVTIEPVVSNSGDVLDSGGENILPYKGCMKLSRNGTRLAVANFGSSLQLFDFNSQTGMVSDPVTMADDWFGSFYGLEFSHSGNILYAGMRYKIRQYDLEAANPGTARTDWIGPESQYGALQIGPDNKIYAANHHVSVINNPDVVGNGCDLDIIGIDVGGNDGRSAIMSLPSFIALPNALDIDFSGNCIGSLVTFSLKSSLPQDSAIWDIGDGASATGLQVEHTFTQPGTYIVKVIATRNGIPGEMQKTVVVMPGPAIGQPQDMMLCDTGNGTAVFDLSLRDTEVLNGQDPAAYTVTYYVSAEDATAGNNSLPAAYTNTASPQTIYARLSANAPGGCYATTSFSLIVEELVIDMPDSIPVCKGSAVQLFAPEGFDSYEWSTGEVTRSIEVTHAGVYTLTVFRDSNGMLCSASKEITVVLTDGPVVTSVDVDDWSLDHNSITINTSEGDYQYSIDGLHFQESNIFENLVSGFYTVYVQNACGIASKEVAVLMYPKFFTPNGDGDNETWAIEYSWFEPDMTVRIFDRYGKLLTSFKGNEPGWDGRYNGHDLPSTDYWFIVERKNGGQYKGHFSMLR